MKNPKHQNVLVSDLIGAEWNYKYKGTDEEIVKLSASIKQDGSAGVFAVREIESDGRIVMEVIDGNHRLEAVKLLGWETAQVENFGNISKAAAVTIARRRNHKWFEDDKLKLGELMVELVIPEFGIDNLLSFMPDSRADLEAFANLNSFDWSQPQLDQSDQAPEDGYKKINLKVGEEVFNLWSKWLERSKSVIGLGSEERAFEFAIIEALNVPEENLKS